MHFTTKLIALGFRYRMLARIKRRSFEDYYEIFITVYYEVTLF